MKDSLQIEIAVKARVNKPSGRSRKKAGEVDTPDRIPRIARLLAVAIKFQDMVDRGEVRDYADLARLGLVTRARLTQIMNLLLLAPDVQEMLLIGVEGNSALCERHIRQIITEVCWEDQRALLRATGRSLAAHGRS